MSGSSKPRAQRRSSNALATIAFIATVSIIEFMIAILVYVRGLTDLYVLILIPLGVIAVLTSNWAYLIRKLAISHRHPKKPAPSATSILGLISRVTSSIPVKSAIIVLAPFLVLVLITLSFAPSLKLLAWLTERGPSQLLPTLKFLQGYIQALLYLSFLRKFIYLQSVSAVASTLVTLLMGFLKGKG